MFLFKINAMPIGMSECNKFNLYMHMHETEKRNLCFFGLHEFCMRREEKKQNQMPMLYDRIQQNL